MDPEINNDINDSDHQDQLGAVGDSQPFYTDLISYPTQKGNHKWAVSWSDLMMTMFIFFAVLYIYQSVNREQIFTNRPGSQEMSETGNNTVVNINKSKPPSLIYDDAKRAIQEVMLDKQSFYDLGKEKAVRLVLAGDFLFDSGRAELKTGARYQLNQVARVLNETNYAINIVGHTDDVPVDAGTFPTNWELSSARAVRVARYLMEEGRVDPARFYISAHAYHQPVVPNDTPDNRALNRRVEIILVKEKPLTQSDQ
ncbi:MAG: hypothetical protein D3926_19580 [Desulfobacteraceae bacterium]|nr:MAG: hypothetical protein D3926_19580 [Desulfobacteraceae bacterium]